MKRMHAVRLCSVGVSLAKRRGRPSSRRGMSGRVRRRGFAMAAVLLYAMAVVTLAAGLMRVSSARQRDFRVAQRKLQAEFLLAAGVSRAQAQLSRGGDYRGESWRCEVSGAEGRPKYGQVAISVVPMETAAGAGGASSGEKGEWEISVVAEYPAEGPQPVRRHRTWRVPAAAAEGAGVSTSEPGSAIEVPASGPAGPASEAEAGEGGRE